MSDTSASITVRGAVRKIVQKRRAAPATLFYSALSEALSVLPTHEDTEEGEASARAVKLVILVVGLLVVLAGYEHRLAILPGVAIMLLALLIPISKHTRKTYLARFRRARFVEVVEQVDARLVHDGRRLILEVGEERLRRVLTNKPFALEQASSPSPREPLFQDVSSWLGVLPKGSRRKRDAIWIGLLHEEKSEFSDNFDPGSADNPIVIDANQGEARELIERLNLERDASS